MYTNLIECDQLQTILSGSERGDNIVIFDCRHDLMNPDYGKNAYSEKHIVGALFASIDDDLSTAKRETTVDIHFQPERNSVRGLEKMEWIIILK